MGTRDNTCMEVSKWKTKKEDLRAEPAEPTELAAAASAPASAAVGYEIWVALLQRTEPRNAGHNHDKCRVFSLLSVWATLSCLALPPLVAKGRSSPDLPLNREQGWVGAFDTCDNRH